MVAIRSTLKLEVPLSYQSNLLISKEYLSSLVQIANQKMNVNNIKIQLLTEKCKLLLLKQSSII